MMTWQHAALMAGAFLALAVLEWPLRRLIARVGEGLDALLAELLAAVDRSRAAVAAVRARIASGVGPLTLLGAIPVATVAGLLIWTDLSVTVATLKSLLPVDVGDWSLTLVGYRVGVAESAALALVGLHVLAGVVLLEALGVTRFFPFEQFVSPRGRRVVLIGAVAALLGLGAISAGLAAWRTEQLRSLAPLGDLGSEELLPMPGERSTPTSAAPIPEPIAAPRLIDRLPTPLMATLAFVVPIAGAFAAASFYFLAISAAGLGLALGLLPLAVLALVLRVIRMLVAWVLQVLGGLVELLTTPVHTAVRTLSRLWTRVASRRPADVSPDGAERAGATPGTPSDAASLPGSTDGVGRSLAPCGASPGGSRSVTSASDSRRSAN